MTLCIAWLNDTDDNVYLASDSRLSFPPDKHVDVAIKVSSIPVRVKSSTDSATGKEDILYQNTLGICFAGSSLGSLILKEHITECFTHLQIAEGLVSISMENICKAILPFYKSVVQALAPVLFENSEFGFVLTGYCPLEEKLRAYFFHTEQNYDSIGVAYKPILQNGERYFVFGTGASNAQSLINQFQANNYLWILREVIQSGVNASVGGHLQFGMFKEKEFHIFGVVLYRPDADLLPEILYQFRGMELYKQDFKIGLETFHIQVTHIDPFKRDFDRIMVQHAIRNNLFAP